MLVSWLLVCDKESFFDDWWHGIIPWVSTAAVRHDEYGASIRCHTRMSSANRLTFRLLAENRRATNHQNTATSLSSLHLWHSRQLWISETVMSFGITGPVLMWFLSYLNGRTQYIRCNRLTSAPVLVICGIPKGQSLGLSSFWCIQLTYCDWLNVTAFIHVGTRTTRRSTVSTPGQTFIPLTASHGDLFIYLGVSAAAYTQLGRGS